MRLFVMERDLPGQGDIGRRESRLGPDLSRQRALSLHECRDQRFVLLLRSSRILGVIETIDLSNDLPIFHVLGRKRGVTRW